MADYTLTECDVYHIPSSEFLDMLLDADEARDAIIDAGEDEIPGNAYLLSPEDCPPDFAETFVVNGLRYSGVRMDGYDPAIHDELFCRDGSVYVLW